MSQLQATEFCAVPSAWFVEWQSMRECYYAGQGASYSSFPKIHFQNCQTNSLVRRTKRYQKQSLSHVKTESFSLLYLLNYVTFVLSRLCNRTGRDTWLMPERQPGSKSNVVNFQPVQNMPAQAQLNRTPPIVTGRTSIAYFLHSLSS